MKGMSLGQAPQAVMMLVICAMMFGAGLLALDKFDDGLTGTALSATNNVTLSIGNFAAMFPTNTAREFSL